MKTAQFFIYLSCLYLLSCSGGQQKNDLSSKERQKEILTSEEQQNKILTLIPSQSKIIIESLPAGYVKNLVTNASETFRYYRSSNLNMDWSSGGEQKASEEILVDVYELKQNATFSTMFKFLNSELDKLCLTQSQIVYFCQKNSTHLSQEGPTFFLFKENNKFFVAQVNVFSDGLQVHVYDFNYKDIWIANVYDYRLVVPAF